MRPYTHKKKYRTIINKMAEVYFMLPEVCKKNLHKNYKTLHTTVLCPAKPENKNGITGQFKSQLDPARNDPRHF